MKTSAALGVLTVALLIAPPASSIASAANLPASNSDYRWDIPPAPGPGYVWVPGHIEASYPARVWVYLPPSWQMPPVPGAQFAKGTWTRALFKYGWNPGHWEAYPLADNVWSKPVYLFVSNAPPPDIIEPIYARADGERVWIEGYWWWHNAWIWAPGHFAYRPHPKAKWIASRWEERDEGGWRFVPGRWR
jgi:hypothetical protein